MVLNIGIIALAAIVPLIIGFIWYHPKVLGTAWMNACGFTQKDLEGTNMPLIFGLTYLLSFFLGISINFSVIHQNHLFSIFADIAPQDQESLGITQYLKDFTTNYGTKFRTFKHGALHGVLAALFFALPVLGINALFERRGFKYIALHTGYWILALALMGGVICQFS